MCSLYKRDKISGKTVLMGGVLSYEQQLDRWSKSYPQIYREMEQFIEDQMAKYEFNFFPIECISSFFDPYEMFICPVVIRAHGKIYWSNTFRTTNVTQNAMACDARFLYDDRASALIDGVDYCLSMIHETRVKAQN